MFCPQCGAPNEDGSIYCAECGAVLDAEAASPVKQYTVEDEAPETPVLFTDIDDTIVGEAAPVPPPMPARPAVPARPAMPVRSAAPVPPPPVRTATATGPSTSGLAIASLLLGIGGLTILPLIGSIAAIILGYMARSDIRQRPHQVEGDGLALAGIVLGWIAVGLAVLGLVLGLGFGLCGLCAWFGTIPAQ